MEKMLFAFCCQEVSELKGKSVERKAISVVTRNSQFPQTPLPTVHNKKCKSGSGSERLLSVGKIPFKSKTSTQMQATHTASTLNNTYIEWL